MKISEKNLVILCVSGAIVVSAAVAVPLFMVGFQKIQVACIGDSITYGLGVEKTRDKDSYPAYLEEYLGKRYVVSNFGKSGATALKKSSIPYNQQVEYKHSLSKKYNVYVLMLGTNDSRPIYWDKSNNGETYQKDFLDLINTYKSKSKNAKFLLMQPPKSFRSMTPMTEDTVNDNLIRTTIADYVSKIGKELDIQVISLYRLTKDHPEWFPDGLHPNAVGNKNIAKFIAKNI